MVNFMKIYPSLWAAGLLSAILAFTALPAPAPAATSPTLFSMDAAGYQQRGGLVYLEVYLMVQRDGLTFVPADTGHQALLQITLNLHSPDTLLSSTTWEVVDRVDDLGEVTPRQKLPDIQPYNLPPGLYTVEGLVKDVHGDTTYRRTMDLELAAFSDSLLALSNIELATQLERSDQTNKFTKNGFLVLPNPQRLYGSAMPMLYYYMEIYNLQGTEGEFTVDRIIQDANRTEVKRLPQKQVPKVGGNVVEVDGFSVASLTTGTYYLVVEVHDPAADTAATEESKFFVYRPEDAGRLSDRQSGGDEESREILAYTDQEIEEAVDGIRFLLNDTQWRNLQGLNPDGKRQFLVRFWKEHDPNPTTAVNEFRQAFEQRKDVANSRYGVFDREGWKTDRGRVYVLYGEPDHIEYHTHDMETRAYEIWQYDSIEGGVIFAFVDRNNYGDYRLVHSTKNGELRRPDWYEIEASIRRK
ncbi:MAG: GWxTD domain-containing protein [Candidatus Zixiibacteriota bacterium]|nr:MAG: GWxTD domain-containing protein [candidate division Zixibacteria bacterium]